MPVFALSRSLRFPDPELAEPEGLLAVGGDLSVPRLVHAYASGVFPWYSEGHPILWWSPDPRLVLDIGPEGVRAPRRLARYLRAAGFSCTIDRAFDRVIRACADTPRPGQSGTWLLPEMIEAYEALHAAGFAHSCEVWRDGELAGGIYGVALGRAFFGESMFHAVPHASKAALLALCGQLGAWGFEFLDCQQTTPHMLALGAREISRREFLDRLAGALRGKSLRGGWAFLDPPPWAAGAPSASE